MEIQHLTRPTGKILSKYAAGRMLAVVLIFVGWMTLIFSAGIFLFAMVTVTPGGISSIGLVALSLIATLFGYVARAVFDLAERGVE